MTLERVIVDLENCFADDMAYVALSRAVNRDGLQIVNFSAGAIKTDALVQRFYSTLEHEDANAHRRTLEQEGLWWFPLAFRGPQLPWLQLFRECEGNTRAHETFHA
jgi:hypothetical protein